MFEGFESAILTDVVGRENVVRAIYLLEGVIIEGFVEQLRVVAVPVADRIEVTI